MKICAVICEYNPFHNGHLYQLREIAKRSGCDKILCLMSGNFTQRGDAAVFDKYTRARHAVLCGADLVLELPVCFAAAPAELFAAGAVHILSAIPSVRTLAFGCESGTAESFLTAARETLREDKAFKAALKENMKDGTSYVRARTQALLSLHADVDESLLSSPNNILGTEYCRAILNEKADIRPLPIPRTGAEHADMQLGKDISSATALRFAMDEGSLAARRALRRNLPKCVREDLPSYHRNAYREAALCALLTASDEELEATPDCSEGLQNRIRTMARCNPLYDEMLKKVVSKRYTQARVKRILLQNFLKIRLKQVRSFLASPLYLRTLALKKECADALLSELSSSAFPALVRRGDFSLLKKEALECFLQDMRADALYAAISGRSVPDFETLFL